MLKTKKTKEILNEWHKFENRNRLNESPLPSSNTGRLKPDVSERARKLLKKLESNFGVGPFFDYSHFDDFDDYDMYLEPQPLDPDDPNSPLGPPSGIQLEYQDVLDFVKSTGEIEINDMNLGDFVIANDTSFDESGISPRELKITNAGIANLPSGQYAEFGYVELDDGERIPVVYMNHFGHTGFYFIPVEYDAKPSINYRNRIGRNFSKR